MNTELVAQEYQILPEVGSTNTALKELVARQNIPEGFCLLTNYQTSGRGQYGKQWDSAPGENLLMSLYLRPNFLSAAESYRLTMSVCLALYDLGLHFNLDTQIKWPNDWFIEQRKLAGVLAESSLKGSTLETCIIGIGMNVNQRQFPYSAASSLHRELNRPMEVLQVFEALAHKLDDRYRQLRYGQGDRQLEEFNGLLYGKSDFVPVEQNGKRSFLRCLEVEASGALRVLWENGKESLLKHQEIRFLMPGE